MKLIFSLSLNGNDYLQFDCSVVFNLLPVAQNQNIELKKREKNSMQTLVNQKKCEHVMNTAIWILCNPCFCSYKWLPNAKSDTEALTERGYVWLHLLKTCQCRMDRL